MVLQSLDDEYGEFSSDTESKTTRSAQIEGTQRYFGVEQNYRLTTFGESRSTGQNAVAGSFEILPRHSSSGVRIIRKRKRVSN